MLPFFFIMKKKRKAKQHMLPQLLVLQLLVLLQLVTHQRIRAHPIFGGVADDFHFAALPKKLDPAQFDFNSGFFVILIVCKEKHDLARISDLYTMGLCQEAHRGVRDDSF